MKKDSKGKDRRSWMIGGGLLLGLGVGFVFLQESALWFVACIFIGLGAGLLLASLLPSKD